MIKATEEFLKQNDELFESRKQKILQAEDNLTVNGVSYYVSNSGNDENDGKSPETAWKTLAKVSWADLKRGDGVFFKRGDLFRGATIETKSGVTYGAYGSGEKPKFYGGDRDYADASLWELYDKEHNIWKCTEKMLDAGTFVFNNGEAHSRKLIPSYKNLTFVCRDDENRIFDVRNEMTKDLDLYWEFDEILTRHPSRGENFPIPEITDAKGTIYLRCDKGNPGEVFDSVESVARRHMFFVADNDNVTIDNVCIKYIGMHGVAAGGHVVSLHVTNCEMGWIGGSIQHYMGTDPNYPQGGRGTVTRFGNAIEIYGGCEDYIASDNYIYEVYDAGITHQITTSKKVTMTGIRYTGNVIEKCVYGIEYFLDQIEDERESYMDDVVMNDNFIRLSGYGWGQQRHNTHTPALIKGWSYVNTARNYFINNNIFDRSAYRMLHLVSLKDEYRPEMHDNTFIQHLGGMIGQIGGNEVEEPKIEMFDENAKSTINNVFGDKSAKVYFIN
ncbi:MAG: hypothetical protein IJC74_07900 [Clostridia bacterium]|nr:hypothetical protein [Clostridia bacterium]